MKPDVVVDVGNTRIKWGRCSEDAVTALAALPPAPEAWREQTRAWGLPSPAVWVPTGVHPVGHKWLSEWLRQGGEDVRVIDSARQLPLRVHVEHPEKVGMDRLLNAVAANAHRRPGSSVVIVDAGSAVTVDLVDRTGVFRGGAILPGLRLMAQSLHDYTALLPLIDVPQTIPPLPGQSTRSAMEAGIFWAVVGGIRALIEQYSATVSANPQIFLTGGDSLLLRPALPSNVLPWPEMTLEGIRLTAEALP